MKSAATVVITTRNRCDELRNALASCLTQDVPLEILVVDDASTDGTADMVAREFPSVRLDRSAKPRGYIVQRNRAAAMATAPYIVSIDDDAVFTDPATVRLAIAEMDHPQIGALAMPFANVKQRPDVLQQAPDDQHLYVRQWFIGTAHMLKTELFRRLGGYRELFYSQFEEFDYCLRMLEAGYVVRAGRTPPIHHLASEKRMRQQIVHYGERNQILLATLNVPLASCPWAVLQTIKQGLQRGFRNKFVWPTVTGLARGVAESLRYLPRRRAVSGRTYRRWRALGLAGDRMTLDQLLAIR
jgi:glycosyltransferase involved in cell wall biosynthesis